MTELNAHPEESPADELRAAAETLRMTPKALREADEKLIEPLAVLLSEAANRRDSAVAIAALVSDETETVAADDIDNLTPLVLDIARAITGRTA